MPKRGEDLQQKTSVLTIEKFRLRRTDEHETDSKK